jgi:hypothetical protein
MVKTAMSQLEDQVEVIRREAYEAGYAAAMQAIREIASRPAPAESQPTPGAPARRGRPPRQPKAAPRKTQVQQARATSKPGAKHLERGSNARFIEEVLRASAPQAARPAEIRAALQRDKGVSLAFTSIRHALGQLEARKAVEQDGNGGSHWGQLPDERGLQYEKLAEGSPTGHTRCIASLNPITAPGSAGEAWPFSSICVTRRL